MAAASASARLRSLATRGAFWSGLSYGGGQTVRLVSNLILTRLLFEEAFGLMALVSVFLTGLSLFSDVGIGPSIVRDERGEDQSFLDTAWTLQAGRGVVLWALTFVGAAPFAEFYDQPELRWLVPISGATAFIAGFNSTKLFTAQRDLALGKLALIEVGSALAAALAMVTWAAFDRSVYALAVGGVAGSLTQLVCSHLVFPGPMNRLRWDKEAAGRIMSFGRWVFLSTALTFVAGQTDRIIFGKLVPIAMLGVYSIAASLAALAPLALSHIALQVLFPVYSRVINEKGDLPAAFREMRWPLLIGGGWMLAGFIAGGETMIDLLYDDRYSAAGWILRLLAIGGWFSVVKSTGDAVFFARGQVYWLSIFNVTKIVGIVTFIPIGHALADFPGAVAGFAGATVLQYFVSVGAMWSARLRALKGDIAASAMVALASCAGWLAALGARALGLHVALEAFAVFLAVSVVYAPLAVPLVRRRMVRRAEAA